MTCWICRKPVDEQGQRGPRQTHAKCRLEWEARPAVRRLRRQSVTLTRESRVLAVLETDLWLSELTIRRRTGIDRRALGSLMETLTNLQLVQTGTVQHTGIGRVMRIYRRRQTREQAA